MGRSSAPNRSFDNVASFSRRIPSADRNSVTTTSAPKLRHRRRNGDSDTPAIGAKKRGTRDPTWYGKVIWLNLNGRRKSVQRKDLTQLASFHSFRGRADF